ncbi:META domain-containing protein [Microbacterium sp. NPDC007973]|uniref:META domain-containing protein n=1 Tax=Microbacterium sp. NPDC007973 TaxID=3364182 RepID=UPI0036E87CB0
MKNISYSDENEENLMLRRAFAVVALIAVGWSITACASSAAESGLTSETGEWVGMGPESLSLRDGKVSGNDGCNGIGGSYKMQDGRIVVTMGLSTKMACPGVDTWLRGIATAIVSDDTMTVYNGAGDQIGVMTRAG